MSIEGLWTTEIHGQDGWENAGVLVLRDGHALGGGRQHYSIGTYDCPGEDFSMSLAITYHGTPRTLLGSADKTLSIKAQGAFIADYLNAPWAVGIGAGILAVVAVLVFVFSSDVRSLRVGVIETPQPAYADSVAPDGE